MKQCPFALKISAAIVALEVAIPTAHAAIPAHLCFSAACQSACNLATGNIHFDCVPIFIRDLTFIVISFSASLSLVMLIVNGFRYMLGPVTEPVGGGGGSDAAKKGILFALVGLVLSLMTYVILDTIVTAVTG